MLTTADIAAHLERISYRPGWAIRVYDGAWDETTPQAKVGYAKPELDVDQAHALLERWLG